MAFSLFTRMEESRLQKESILKRRGNIWPVMAAGILLVIIAIFFFAISLSGDTPTPVEPVSGADDTSGSVVAYICAACFGIPAIGSFLTGLLLNLSVRQKLEKAEQEYQKLRFQVISMLEDK